MAALFSAIVSNYNHGAYIADAVRSVLSCGDPDSEVIVVDDGSTDDSAEVLAQFKGHPQVKVVLKENGGQASAFNRGLIESQGELVALFDGDDFWFPNKIRECRAFVDEAGLMGGHWYLRHPLIRIMEFEGDPKHPREYLFSNGVGRVHIPMGNGGVVSTPEELISNMKFLRFPPYLGGDFGGSTVAARKTMEAIFPLPESISKHYGDMFPCMAAGFLGPVHGLMKFLGAYRIHGGNHSLTRLREPYELWKGAGLYVDQVLKRHGISATTNFDESIAARPYLIEQGRSKEVVEWQAKRAQAGSEYDRSLKGRMATQAMILRQMLRGSK